jgi:type IV secretory pathway TrbD component
LDELTRPVGFEVPLRRSLTEPILIAGLPRRIAFVLWTIGFAVALGLREAWVLVPALGAHWACALATKHDPQVLEVFFKAYHNPKRFEP